MRWHLRQCTFIVAMAAHCRPPHAFGLFENPATSQTAVCSRVPEVGTGVPARRTGNPGTCPPATNPKSPPAGTCGEPGTKHGIGSRVCAVLCFVAAAPHFCPRARSARFVDLRAYGAPVTRSTQKARYCEKTGPGPAETRRTSQTRYGFFAFQAYVRVLVRGLRRGGENVTVAASWR